MISSFLTLGTLFFFLGFGFNMMLPSSLSLPRQLIASMRTGAGFTIGIAIGAYYFWSQ